MAGNELLERVRAAVAAVPDPELPALSIADLGILRDVTVDGDRVIVTVTPTYSGCPALDAIRADVEAAAAAVGAEVEVRTVLAPAWTTDWMTDAGRRALAEYGIAPPGPRRDGPVALTLSVRCPQCGSPDTRETSRFSATACQSLWSCRSCREPFTHFKAH
ncbi:MAG: 1,2-phenylacetyl-CoA epoxidase subunit PaaD [Sporichthyaceae bacterium]